jgi:N-acetylglucosaminyldiphosphoundecaprenol N-acetyl-beta-D-mannosaminyltransferase
MPATQRPANEAQPGGSLLGGVRVNLPTLAAATAEAVRRAVLGRGFLLFTLNLDDLVKVRSNPAFGAVYRRADLVTADGWPIVWLAAREGIQVERTCGADLVEPLCRAAAESGLGVYFIGPGPTSQGRALDRLRRIADLQVAGAETPPIPAGADPSILQGVDVNGLASRVNASGAGVCFISLGHPKQGYLAEALAARCPTVGFVCVGAALDFIAGSVRRAPGWVQGARLEWLWRLVGEPRRLAVRYAVGAPVFVRLVIEAWLRPRRAECAGVGASAAIARPVNAARSPPSNR